MGESNYTVGELIKRFENKLLYVGAQSGYIWIGQGTDAEWVLKFADKKYKLNRAELVRKYKVRYRNLVASRVDTQNMIDYCNKDSYKKLARLKKNLASLDKRIESIERSIDSNQAYLDNWVNFLDRNVKDVFVREKIFDYDKRGIAIIFEGDESGYYWDINEFNKRPHQWMA